jgi:hypothetical protein
VKRTPREIERFERACERIAWAILIAAAIIVGK